MATSAADRATLPRWVSRLGLPAAAVALTLLFALASFPWERLRDPAARQLERVSGARIAIETLGPSLGLAGPVLVLRGVRATWPDRTHLELDRAALRPAWTLAWLVGRPGLHLDLESPIGDARGTLFLGDEPGWDGEIRELALGQAPYLDGLSGLALEGRADISARIRLTADGPQGALELRARDGSVAADGLPVALPFAALEADLGFAERGRLEVKRLDLDGPMLAARVQGGVEGAQRLESAGLDLVVDLEVRERALIPGLASQGLRVGADGRGRVRLRGPIHSPRVLPESR